MQNGFVSGALVLGDCLLKGRHVDGCNNSAGLDKTSLDALVKLRCFEGLPAIIQAELAVRTSVMSFSANDVILPADQRVDKIYVVCEGSARVLLAGPLSCIVSIKSSEHGARAKAPLEGRRSQG